MKTTQEHEIDPDKDMDQQIGEIFEWEMHEESKVKVKYDLLLAKIKDIALKTGKTELKIIDFIDDFLNKLLQEEFEFQKLNKMNEELTYQQKLALLKKELAVQDAVKQIRKDYMKKMDEEERLLQQQESQE